MNTFNTHEVLYSHFDAVIPMSNTHIVLVLKKNYDPRIKTTYVAGIPGGVFSLDAKENGEGQIGFDPQSERSFVGVITRQLSAGLKSFSLESNIHTLNGLGKLAFAATFGDQRAGNAVKELVEETGLVAVNLLPFRESAMSKHGEQNFYIANKFFSYNSKSKDFDVIENLTDVENFICTDPDIARVKAVPISEIFTSKIFTVIGSHKKQINKAISFYKDFQEKST